MIKEIKTQKFEGIAVLLPEDFKEIAGSNNNELFYWTDTCTQSMGDYPYSVHVPNVLKYDIIGFVKDITEEHAAEIVEFSTQQYTVRHYKNYCQHKIGVYVYEFKKAKESFQSLMQSIGCYSVNPLSDPELTMRQGDGYVYYSASDEDFEEYEKAEANTGTWLILKKL